MCLKNTQNVSLEFLILAFFHQFLSLHGNTVWLQPVGFQKLVLWFLNTVTFTFWVDKSSLKMPKTGNLTSFWKHSSRSSSVTRHFANIENIKWDILSTFQTICFYCTKRYSLGKRISWLFWWRRDTFFVTGNWSFM